MTALGALTHGRPDDVRVENPILTRNPYLLADSTWGWVYVLHGLSAVGLVGLIIAHVYFAVLPEKWWMTMSMIAGWITRRKTISSTTNRIAGG